MYTTGLPEEPFRSVGLFRVPATTRELFGTSAGIHRAMRAGSVAAQPGPLAVRRSLDLPAPITPKRALRECCRREHLAPESCMGRSRIGVQFVVAKDL